MPSPSGPGKGVAYFGIQVPLLMSDEARAKATQGLQTCLKFIDPNNARAGWLELDAESSGNPSGFPATPAKQLVWLQSVLLADSGLDCLTLTESEVHVRYEVTPDPNEPGKFIVTCITYTELTDEAGRPVTIPIESDGIDVEVAVTLNIATMPS